MAEIDDETRRVADAVLVGLDKDLEGYEEHMRSRGMPVSRRKALDDLEQMVNSPKHVAARRREATEYGVDPAIIDGVWRECFRRLRLQSSN